MDKPPAGSALRESIRRDELILVRPIELDGGAGHLQLTLAHVDAVHVNIGTETEIVVLVGATDLEDLLHHLGIVDQLRGKPPRSGGGQERGGEVAQCHRSRPCRAQA